MPENPTEQLPSHSSEPHPRGTGGGQGENGKASANPPASGQRPHSLAPEPDIFGTADDPRILRGIAVYSGATRLAELAAHIGFETIWIEMEHGPTDFGLGEALCMAIEAGGGIPTVRIPDGQRHHVLRALEIGARIVVVPMINTAAQAAQLVQHGKFPPLGQRGYNVRSRGVEYGLVPPKAAFVRANQRTHLFAQIETVEAVQNLDSICAVDGLSGIFIGPGDLSVSFGCTGELSGPKLIETVCDCIRRARAAGKYAGILVPPGTMLTAAIEAGCNLTFFGGDITELGKAWPSLLATVPSRAAAR
jgi:4-hydroxy-2-oxoheptanedioate aldolase